MSSVGWTESIRGRGSAGCEEWTGETSCLAVEDLWGRDEACRLWSERWGSCSLSWVLALLLVVCDLGRLGMV